MIKNSTANELFENARFARSNISSDYISIKLSTGGKVYAPKEFHIKNFTVNEVLDIALAEQEELPNKILEILNTKILEEDVDLGSFTREEYIETIFIFFKCFYTTTLKKLPYKLQEADYIYLQKMKGGKDSPQYNKLLRELNSGTWKPCFNLDLNVISFYDIPKNFIKKVTIDNKNSTLSYTYGLPCYRDLRDIDDFIQILFKEEAKELEPIEKLLKLRNDQLRKKFSGQNVSLDNIPKVPKDMETKYNNYVYRRQTLYAVALRAAFLRELNGKDISRLPIEEKIKIANNPKIELRYYTNFVGKIKDQKIGLKSEVVIVNPITNSKIDYNVSLDSLISLRPFEPDNLYELIVSLSKNTANSVSDIMNMQMDKVLALHNTLANLAEKEKAASEKQREEQASNLKAPNLNMAGMQSQINQMTHSLRAPSMPNMPSLPNIR